MGQLPYQASLPASLPLNFPPFLSSSSSQTGPLSCFQQWSMGENSVSIPSSSVLSMSFFPFPSNYLVWFPKQQRESIYLYQMPFLIVTQSIQERFNARTFSEPSLGFCVQWLCLHIGLMVATGKGKRSSIFQMQGSGQNSYVLFGFWR